MNVWLDFLITSLAFGATFIYGSTGEILTEKAGHLNLGIPGIMCMGGAGGCLILNMIGGTCNQPHPGPDAEKRVRSYLERGGSILLLHGSSAAFWQWDWWRRLPGERWVRPNDPDGVASSTHPRRPYTVRVSKSRHLLTSRLKEMELPEDEIYINLENTCPCMRLMETHIEEGTFVQCCEAATPWGGKLISFIPGHKPEVTADPVLIANIVTLIDHLLEK